MTPQPQTPNSQLAKIADLLQIQIDDATIMHTEILTALTALQDAISSLTAATAAQPAAIAAPATPAAAPANVRDFAADTLILSIDDNGKPAYKVRGFPYSEFGIRIWPETLPILGIDAASLKPGPNPLPAGLIVRCLLTDEGKPKKVIGLGNGSCPISTIAMSTLNAASAQNGNGHKPAPAKDEPPF